MGENYYHHRNVCPHCNRPETREHIGKASCGWTFSFHATEKIKTYAQWLERLAEPGGVIVDEYGDAVSLEDFKNIVKSKMREKKNHAIACANDRDGFQRSFLDPEGHSFSEGEFC